MSYNSVHKGPKILAKMSVPATHTMKQFCNSSSPKAMVSSYCCQLMVRCFSANTPLFTFSADTLMHLRKTLLSLWELGLFNWYNYKQVDHYEEMYNETGCHEFKRMQPTEVVRVFLRIKGSLPSERICVFSEHAEFSQDAWWGTWKDGKLLLNKPIYYMK